MQRFLTTISAPSRKREGARKQVLLAGASAFGIACFMSAPADAQAQAQSNQDENLQQEEGKRLEEIIVTGTRREESLNEIAASITAFTESDIATSNIEGVDDYFFRTPNVSFTSAGSRDQKSLSIRGVTNQINDDQMVRGQTFAFYINEFNVATATNNPPMLDVERIEVFRGPQGIFFGRNAIGGAINMTTKKPTNDWYLETGVEYSRFDTFELHGIANVPIIDDVLALRVAAKREEGDGNLRNIHPINKGNSFDYDYIRPSLRFTPTDRLTVDIQGTLSEETVDMREGVPTGVLSTFARNIFFGGDPDATGVAEVGFFPENTRRVNFNRPQAVGRNFHYITGRAVYEFDSFSVTSVTGFIDSKQFLQGDIDGSGRDTFFESKDQFREKFSQEIRFQSRGGGDFEWTIGGIFTDEEGRIDQHTNTGEDNPFGLPVGFAVTETFQDGENESYAGFGNVSWHATAALTLQLGGRFTHEQVNVRGFNVSGGERNTQVDESADFSDFSPRFSVNYQATDAVSVYGVASKGFKSGGIQVSTIIDEPAFGEENVWNFEVGTKGELFDGRFRYSAAAFFMDWDDLQSDFALGVVRDGDIEFVSGIQNAGAASNKGFELEFTALPMDNLRLDFSVGYLDSEFDTFEDAFVDGEFVDLSGRRTPNSPKWTLNGSAEYTFPVLEEYEGFLRAEWFYRGKNLGGDVSPKVGLVRQEFPFVAPSFNNVDLRAGLRGERFTLRAFVENATDNTYFTNSFQKGFVGGVHVEPSFLNWGFSITMKLGEGG